jgi:hypothetical protein
VRFPSKVPRHTGGLPVGPEWSRDNLAAVDRRLSTVDRPEFGSNTSEFPDQMNGPAPMVNEPIRLVLSSCLIVTGCPLARAADSIAAHIAVTDVAPPCEA